MPVFSLFFKIAKKHLPKNLIFFVIYIVLILALTGAGTQTKTGDFTAYNYDIVIQDMDNSKASQALIEYLDSIHDIVTLSDYSQESITDNLFYQRISYSLVIPEGFEKNLIGGQNKDLVSYSMRKDSAAGYFLTEQVNGYLDSIYLFTQGGFSVEEAIEHTNETFMDDVTEVKVFEETGKEDNVGMFYYFQYMPYTMIMVICATMSPIMMILHDPELESRMNVSKIGKRKRSLWLGLACATFSLMVWLLFMVVAVVVFGTDLVGSEVGRMCILNSFVFNLVATGIALIIGSFDLKGSAIDLVNNIIALGMSFLCGIFVPQYFLGANVLAVAKFLPAFWYIKIHNMLSGASGEVFSKTSYWNWIGIEMIFVVAIYSVYMVVASQRKKR